MNSTNKSNTRREFLKHSLAVVGAGGALSAMGTHLSGTEMPPSKKYRLAVVGTGARCVSMWGPSVEREYADHVEFVGLCDINFKRVQYVQSLFESKPPVYTDFDRMLLETSPDAVVITTVDAYHVHYAVRAMQLGCDVICEKPLATTAEDCQLLYDSEKQTGCKVTVTLNARYFVDATQVKKLLVSGAIGDLYSVDYSELLDLSHGASYFRRWHGIKAKSGTLLCTKSSHHFDHVNWWVNSEPSVVSSFGKLREYGSNGPFRSSHCRGCPHQNECKFYWDITQSPRDMKLYVECEDEDGYLRDGCVYRNEIDIYDTMSLQCRYKNGVLLTYSLNAASPIEGQIISLNGSEGRIELRAFKRQPWQPERNPELRLITNNPHESKIILLKPGKGGHGGADPALKDHIFYPGSDDPYGHRAGSKAGIYSSLIGIAGYESIESGQPVVIDDIINLG